MLVKNKEFKKQMKTSVQNIRDASPDSDILCIKIKVSCFMPLFLQPFKAARSQRQGPSSKNGKHSYFIISSGT
jgi:hypothetical protein